MSDFVEGSIQTNGINLHFYRIDAPVKKSLLGRTRPTTTIILLHGVTDSGECWKRTAQALCHDYNLVMPDSRGHGLSDAPENGYGVEDRAADVAGLIQALAIERPVLLGHSMGAETAIGTAALFPQLLRGVILEDPPWPGRFWGSTLEERAERAAQWREDLLQQKSWTIQELISDAHEQHPTWHKDELDPWAGAKQLVSPNITNVVFAPRRRWSDYVRQAECPILLITGDPEHGALVTSSTAQEAALFWKNGRTVNIPNAGHNIHREQFEPFMHAVKEFLTHLG